jgi:hypothetical protein
VVFHEEKEDTMPTLLTTEGAICTDRPPWSPDDAQLAAAAFLALDPMSFKQVIELVQQEREKESATWRSASE